MFKTPILLLMFNRPAHCLRLIAALRNIRPKYLFVSADGPRQNRAGEEVLCAEARQTLDTIDWECEVITHFQSENQGCRLAVSNGITWFFEQVEAGIILEDDCIPQSGFFNYCAALLERYSDETDIMMVSGNHPLPALTAGADTSYHFTHYPFIWGWATWRRAWQHYDLNMLDLDKHRDILKTADFLSNPLSEAYLWDKFIQSKRGVTNTWDFQWFYTILKVKGKCIIPDVNMIENIGLGEAATHTSTTSLTGRTNTATDITFPLRHPGKQVILTKEQHQALFYAVFKPKGRLVIWYIRNLIRKLFHPENRI